MRNLFLFNMVTLDGYFEGPNQDIDWHAVDEEFNEFAVEQLDTIDTILFGRVTYEGMASFWPTPFALENEPMVAGRMNKIAKVVFSRTLDKAEWQNTQLVKEDVAGFIAQLKGQPGKDIAIFGSANLAASLLSMGLIDELRLIVNPVILGSGTPLFRDVRERIDLKLTKTRVFDNGNVLLYYRLR